MRLIAFRIWHFRSIVDSGWNQLSTDNITGIIGQNESGKTSILEALQSFYTGEITDEVLRSDLTLPIVSCSFELPAEDQFMQLDPERMPEGLLKSMKKSKQLILSRHWNEDKSSRIEVGGEEISKIFQAIGEAEEHRDKRVKDLIHTILSETQNLRNTVARLSHERQKMQDEQEAHRVKLAEAERNLRKIPKGSSKDQGEKLVATLQNQIHVIAEKIRQKNELLKENTDQLEGIIPKTETAVAVTDTERKVSIALENINSIQAELIGLQHIIEYTTQEKDRRGALLKLDHVQEAFIKANSELQHHREQLEKKKVVLERLSLGKTDLRSVMKEVDREFGIRKTLYTKEELGTELFRGIPLIEMFEDFGSLLPNRIDLQDILSGNQQAEGYKAARNFLLVSGLNADFFRHTDNRILKQKIEKLNKEVTVDFQDYWRQNVGKKNKIKIHFELEHYDTFHNEKVGQPYLEFWIKDDYERLYPKQRSRGVRWFLSFYLELKAIAADKENKGRILLIDEPGLSLHARAQEDVLKVFEDIKGKVQVIYTTHSPHLIDLNKLYRLLAVQRADVNDERSETILFDSQSLQEASSDTLSPIYTLMGARITDQKYIQRKNNIILEDICAYYYFSTFFRLLGISTEVFLLPATDVNHVTILVNLLMGWGFDFIVVLDDDDDGNRVFQELNTNLYYRNEKKTREKILKMDGVRSIEDIFSTIDFKKYILQKREGIPESNSEYIENSGLSRSVLASRFYQRIIDEKITFNQLDDESRENILRVMKKLQGMINA